MVSMEVIWGSPIFLQNAALSWNPNVSFSGHKTHYHQALSWASEPTVRRPVARSSATNSGFHVSDL
jgi:hypothetical protein